MDIGMLVLVAFVAGLIALAVWLTAREASGADEVRRARSGRETLRGGTELFALMHDPIVPGFYLMSRQAPRETWRSEGDLAQRIM